MAIKSRRTTWICISHKFSDESYFIREGIFNRHNYHIWANKNLHEYLPINCQYRFSINLWAGIVDNTLVSIIFYYLYLRAS